ncbi:MAG: zeta toxin family protein [Candidatus Peregrinibacteria bacterium]|nr:zeta toxin family protein [Candidatus Peregrinibacteria bacterium]
MTHTEIKATADFFARRNKGKIAKELTDPVAYTPSGTPISIFMAGSPGAGKTEFSKSLIKTFEKSRPRVVRIDGDELREHLPGYTGMNSSVFQGAISLIIEKMHDLVLQKSQNFILDGTLWKYEKAIKNIERSLKKKRPVFIFYVYQKPDVAWDFAKKREVLEGRNIPKQAFIDQFFGSRNTVNKIRSEYGPEVIIYLVKKDHGKNTVEKLIEIEPGDNIDRHIPRGYTKTRLKKDL